MVSRFSSFGILALTLATILAVLDPRCCNASVLEPERGRGCLF